VKKLLSLDETSALIRSGARLVVAGDERLLAALPAGTWIGGTTPYFMGDTGGTFTKDHIYVDAVPVCAQEVRIQSYDTTTLAGIAADEFDNGYTIVIIPGFSDVHVSFAERAPDYRDIFVRPLLGWVAGFDRAEIATAHAQVFDGTSTRGSGDHAVAMHVQLPPGTTASLDIVNIFTQGTGDAITFPTRGFTVEQCEVNGVRTNFADYVLARGVDTHLPLVADYYGALINISFQHVDAESRRVQFFAPVFPGVVYKLAAPVGDYVAEFGGQLRGIPAAPAFTCNCVLNYVYGGLEGRKTSTLTGPLTFGEIAYQLLNQTMVYLAITDGAHAEGSR
jgi:hypothetical protein